MVLCLGDKDDAVGTLKAFKSAVDAWRSFVAAPNLPAIASTYIARGSLEKTSVKQYIDAMEDVPSVFNSARSRSVLFSMMFAV